MTGRAMVVLLVVVALGVSYAHSLRVWLDQRAEIASLEQTIESRRAHVERLRTELDRWEDPAYVEARARQRLLWVMPGEVGYRVIGRNAARANRRADREDVAWYERAWASIEAAGRPDRPGNHRDVDRPEPVRRIGPG